MTVRRTSDVSNAKTLKPRGKTFEEFLFQLRFGDFDLDGFVDLFGVAAAVVGVVFDGRGEEGVDEGCFA